MGKNPAFQFYPGDWLQDTSVLTLEAKGAWIDLLCAMWRSETRGTLNLTIDQYSRLLRVSTGTTKSVLEELMLTKCGDVFCANVTLSNAAGNDLVTVSNRRMVREEKERQGNRKRGVKHREKKKTEANDKMQEQPYNGPNNENITVPSSSSTSSSFLTTFEKKEGSTPASTGGKKKSKPEVSEKAKLLAGMWYDRCLQWDDEYAKRETREHYIKKAAPLWDKELKTSKGTNEDTVTAALDYIEHHHGTNGFSWKGKVYSPAGLFTGEKPKWPMLLNQSKGNDKPIVLDMWDEPVTDEENEKGKEYYRLKEAQERMQEGEHDLDEVSGDDDITLF